MEMTNERKILEIPDLRVTCHGARAGSDRPPISVNAQFEKKITREGRS
jgi:hypothetical protein